MSQNENSILLERASELLEEVHSHPSHLDDTLKEAVESGDMECINYWVTIIEGMLAQEYYGSTPDDITYETDSETGEKFHRSPTTGKKIYSSEF